MRRLLLGLCAGVFFGFVTVQAIHWHADVPRDFCGICVLGDNAVRHVPQVAPALVLARTSTLIVEGAWIETVCSHHSDTVARAPPLA